MLCQSALQLGRIGTIRGRSCSMDAYFIEIKEEEAAKPFLDHSHLFLLTYPFSPPRPCKQQLSILSENTITGLQLDVGYDYLACLLPSQKH